MADPADQAEALLLQADAKAARNAPNPDPEAWKDVALTYMRAVVIAPAPSSTAAQALLKTAAIHETRLNEKATALQIYQQVANDYKGQEAARAAEREIKRIKG